MNEFKGRAEELTNCRTLKAEYPRNNTQRLANFSNKKLPSKYFRVCGPSSLWCDHSTLPLQWESCHR